MRPVRGDRDFLLFRSRPPSISNLALSSPLEATRPIPGRLWAPDVGLWRPPGTVSRLPGLRGPTASGSTQPASATPEVQRNVDLSETALRDSGTRGRDTRRSALRAGASDQLQDPAGDACRRNRRHPGCQQRAVERAGKTSGRTGVRKSIPGNAGESRDAGLVESLAPRLGSRHSVSVRYLPGGFQVQ